MITITGGSSVCTCQCQKWNWTDEKCQTTVEGRQTAYFPVIRVLQKCGQCRHTKTRPWESAREKFRVRFMVPCALATSNTVDYGTINFTRYTLKLAQLNGYLVRIKII